MNNEPVHTEKCAEQVDGRHRDWNEIDPRETCNYFNLPGHKTALAAHRMPVRGVKYEKRQTFASSSSSLLAVFAGQGCFMAAVEGIAIDAYLRRRRRRLMVHRLRLLLARTDEQHGWRGRDWWVSHRRGWGTSIIPSGCIEQDRRALFPRIDAAHSLE